MLTRLFIEVSVVDEEKEASLFVVEVVLVRLRLCPGPHVPSLATGGRGRKKGALLALILGRNSGQFL